MRPAPIIWEPFASDLGKIQLTTKDDRRDQLGRRRRDDQGLPADDDLRKLALVHLQNQRRLWPELIPLGLLPEPTDQVISQMVQDFKSGFLDGVVVPYPVPAGTPPWLHLGVGYERYSCDNSNPRSLDDQLHLQLERARREATFIPWQYVFADASVSGTFADRTGYKLAKAVLEHGGSGAVHTLFIDEVGRASRDAIEALRLGKFIDRTGKRMLGISDGFDSANEMAKFQLHWFSMFNEYFIDQLRAKVFRGLKGATRRGTSTGRPALGVKLVPVKDAAGNVVYDADGVPVKTYATDDDWWWAVEMAFDLYGNKHQSGDEIAREFNRRRVGGRDTWCTSSIYQLLRRYLYRQIKIYNMFCNTRDSETGKRTTLLNPRTKWVVKRLRNLKRISRELWKKVQARLIEVNESHPLKARKLKSRNDLYPSTMVSGLLFCGDCGHELLLMRSFGKYQQLGCPNANAERYGCKQKGSKTLRVIEKRLLEYVLGHVLTQDRLTRTVESANRYLLEEAQKPQADTSGLRSTLNELKARRDRLVQLFEVNGDEDLSSVRSRLSQLEKEIKEVTDKVHAAEAVNAAVPAPINLETALAMLTQVRDLLNQEPRMAAKILRLLFGGKIVVRQVAAEGRKRPDWVAEVRSDLVALIAGGLKGQNCPDSSTWEYLRQRIWIIPETEEVPLDHVPQYAAYAPQVKELREKGLSYNQIGSALGITLALARDADIFVKTGVRPVTKKPGRRTGTRTGKTPQYMALAPEVARLRDQEQRSFADIMRQLGVSRSIVQRAYDYQHRGDVQDASEQGQRFHRGSYHLLDPEKCEQIRRLLAEGRTRDQIAELVGCSSTTVWRMLKQMDAEGQK